jgi:predicted proteasome-type protease
MNREYRDGLSMPSMMAAEQRPEPTRFEECPLRDHLGMVRNAKLYLCPCLLHGASMSQPGENYKLWPLSNIVDTIPRTPLIALCECKYLRFEAFSSCNQFHAIFFY